MKVIVVHVLQNIDYIHVHAHVSISSLILHNTCFNCPDSNVKYSRLIKKKINEEKKIYFKVALLIAKWKKSFLSSFFQQEFKRRCPLSYKICYHACNKHLTPPPPLPPLLPPNKTCNHEVKWQILHFYFCSFQTWWSISFNSKWWINWIFMLTEVF